jgi:hypothetical protein
LFKTIFEDPEQEYLSIFFYRCNDLNVLETLCFQHTLEFWQQPEVSWRQVSIIWRMIHRRDAFPAKKWHTLSEECAGGLS